MQNGRRGHPGKRIDAKENIELKTTGSKDLRRKRGKRNEYKGILMLRVDEKARSVE